MLKVCHYLSIIYTYIHITEVCNLYNTFFVVVKVYSCTLKYYLIFRQEVQKCCGGGKPQTR